MTQISSFMFRYLEIIIILLMFWVCLKKHKNTFAFSVFSRKLRWYMLSKPFEEDNDIFILHYILVPFMTWGRRETIHQQLFFIRPVLRDYSGIITIRIIWGVIIIKSFSRRHRESTRWGRVTHICILTIIGMACRLVPHPPTHTHTHHAHPPPPPSTPPSTPPPPTHQSSVKCSLQNGGHLYSSCVGLNEPIHQQFSRNFLASSVTIRGVIIIKSFSLRQCIYASVN